MPSMVKGVRMLLNSRKFLKSLMEEPDSLQLQIWAHVGVWEGHAASQR